MQDGEHTWERRQGIYITAAVKVCEDAFDSSIEWQAPSGSFRASASAVTPSSELSQTQQGEEHPLTPRPEHSASRPARVCLFDADVNGRTTCLTDVGVCASMPSPA